MAIAIVEDASNVSIGEIPTTSNKVKKEGNLSIQKPVKIKRRRDPLSPKPILDKLLLREALDARGIVLKELQLDTFYQLLHRQHYPPLKDFVLEYYRNDTVSQRSTKDGNNSHNVRSPIYGDGVNRTIITTKEQSTSHHLPTKNPISNKRKNLRQLPKAFLEFLADPQNDFVTVTSTIESRPTSKDGTTTKMAVRLQDGHVVESVLMRHISNSGSRSTLCVSSQVGCAMGCTFCATGTMGIRGNLTSGEILEQLVHAGRILAEERCADNEACSEQQPIEITSVDGSKKKIDRGLEIVRNIVFMGMVSEDEMLYLYLCVSINSSKNMNQIMPTLN